MKSAGKARNNGLYRHIRTSKEIIRNLLNDFENRKSPPYYRHQNRTEGLVYENLFKELLDGYHAKFLFHSASCIFSFTIIYITTTFHKKQPIH